MFHEFLRSVLKDTYAPSCCYKVMTFRNFFLFHLWGSKRSQGPGLSWVLKPLRLL